MSLDEFTTRIGTDLVTHTDHNMLHHIGEEDFSPSQTGRNLHDPSAVAECQPWEWVWRIAANRSLAPGCSKTESWDAKVRQQVAENTFSK